MSAWHAGPQSDKMPSRKLRSAKQSPEDDYNPSRRQTKTVMVPEDKPSHQFEDIADYSTTKLLREKDTAPPSVMLPRTTCSLRELALPPPA